MPVPFNTALHCPQSRDDSVTDHSEDGCRLKMMPGVNEYTRECLALEVEQSIIVTKEA